LITVTYNESVCASFDVYIALKCKPLILFWLTNHLITF